MKLFTYLLADIISFALKSLLGEYGRYFSK